ncbi:MAG: hypothetical protein ACOCP8_10450 [archaeon]
MAKEKFENRADVTGVVNFKEFNPKIGGGLGRIGINANDNVISVQMWEKVEKDKPLDIVKNYIENGVKEGDKVNVIGELEERFYDKEYRRQIVNRMISKEQVYGIEKLDEEIENEDSLVRLSGNVLGKEINLTNTVKGENVDEGIEKLELTLVYFNKFNPKTKKEDLDKTIVLEKQINNQINFLKNNATNNKISYEDYEKMKKKLEENSDPNTFFSVLKDFLEKTKREFNIKTFHLCAYGDLARNIYEDIEIGDNITVGCDILNTQIYDKYGIPQGSLNEVVISSYGGVNKKSDLNEPDKELDKETPW